MPLWSIEAAASAQHSRWLDLPIWADVVVRAPTAAEARLVAAHMEQEAIGAGRTTAGNESLPFRSGFDDEKLYHVRRVELSGVSEDGPAAVLSARQVRPPARP